MVTRSNGEEVMVRMRVSRFLKIFRVTNDLTQRELAERLGMSISAYNAAEQGISDYRISLLEKIEEILKVDIEDVFREFNVPS